MTIINILSILSQIPALADAVAKIIMAIHATPGTPEHVAATTDPVK